MQRRLVIVAIVFVVGFGLGYGATWLLVGPPGVVKPDITTAAVAEPQPNAPATASAGDVIAAPTTAAVTVDAADAAASPVDAVAPAPAPAEPAAPAEAAPNPVEPAQFVGHPCVGRTCRLDFGGVSGGISVRRGRVDNGQEVDWERDFGAADKLGLIPAGPKVRVEVRAVAMLAGEPSAAWVVFKNRGTTLNGVIALKVGDKRLSLNTD